MLQPLIIQRCQEREEPLERLALDAVAPGISVQRHEADRRFPAECAILAIEAKHLPRPQVKGVPRFRLGTGRRLFNRPLQPLFLRIGLDEFFDPLFVLWRLPAYLPAEGASEFFVASVTNST